MGVVVLGAPATAAASYYGEGSYFGNEYYGLAGVTAPGGGGTCLNCEGGEGSSGSGSSSAGSTTKPVDKATAGTSVGNSGTPAHETTATSSRGHIHIPECTILAEAHKFSDSSITAIVELLFTTGIIPADKQAKACDALQKIMIPKEAAPFSTPLKKGDRSEEVRRLQQFLNAHGFVLASGTELGAPGHETDLFGILTFDAVKRFQAAHAAEILAPVGLTVPSGFWGPGSMRKANALLGV